MTKQPARGYARFVCATLSLCTLAEVPSTMAGPGGFNPNETLVTPQRDLIDAEYSQKRGEITWVDATGHLWIAAINRASGMFEPSNGKGRMIDPDAMNTFDLRVVGNGPEWISMANTDQIVYTKFLPGRPHTQPYARLAVAAQNKSGGWTYSYFNTTARRNAPYASSNPGDPAPAISYVDPWGNHYWSPLAKGAAETLVGAYPPSSRSMRFVRGARASVFVAPVNGVSQVFRYWLDTQVTEQLTFDDGDKDLASVPWMWLAPEYNDFVLLTIANKTELRFYRLMDKVPNSAGQLPWSMVRNVAQPAHGELSSPEPFVYNGRSFVFFTAALPGQSYQSQVYVADIDGHYPSLRQLTPDTNDGTARLDPEIFFSENGPLIYFNRFNALRGTPGQPGTSEGVYLTRTGL